VKLAVVLESDVSSGGGYHQGLNAAREVCTRAGNHLEVTIWTDVAGNIEPLRKMGMRAELFKRSWADRLQSIAELSRLGQRAVARVGWLDGLEKALRHQHVDLAYFVTPSVSASRLKHLAHVTTVWDLCHRDWPEFPEVQSGHQFLAREHLYSGLCRAQLVIADSDELAAKIARRYGVDEDRILAVPFGPSPFVAPDEAAAVVDVLPIYDLAANYLFYPAQFWAHKNHLRIVQALGKLREHGLFPQVAFAGADKGNRAHVRETARKLGVEGQVKFLGMVPSHHLHGLYANCGALVMPTYFGPTNLPPLEAWTLGKPVIYSRHLASQAGGAAILVDPDSADELAAAIRAILDGSDARDWQAIGRARLAELASQRDDALVRLMQRLETFDVRRQCWS
jgi:glycosyltransferase involved in cell wall biosynthesis